ncbi:MAG: dimethyl sulfoxide reductase anchor subunit [Sulfuritalea sp.]|nr:dimethyl sulfoxide reductase anchor subunit [Sulfuritalea sp.]
MKPFIPRAAALAAPKQQRNWDWRAAANFICGGAGGGLLLAVAFAGIETPAARIAVLLGLALIATGLTCVWFEIGRPWRAMNVYRHFATSWMTREAVVALVVFAMGGLALLTGAKAFIVLAGICGLAFLYSQARILAANKGIPAWRHPASVPLLVGTGLAEGAGFLSCVAAWFGAAASSWVALVLMVLIGLRAWFWKSFLARLDGDGAPDAALKVLHGMSSRLLLLGHAVPAIAAALALAGAPGRGGWLLAAGFLTVGGGWFMKYTLVRRAAFTQGLSIAHLPVRGRGVSGPQVKPGWKSIPGAKAG